MAHSKVDLVAEIAGRLLAQNMASFERSVHALSSDDIEKSVVAAKQIVRRAAVTCEMSDPDIQETLDNAPRPGVRTPKM